jgi:hypothetical protein
MRASITSAVASGDYTLHITLDNGNELSFNVKQFFEYPFFAQLENAEVWLEMKVGEYSVSWGEGDLELELSIDTILNYFA